MTDTQRNVLKVFKTMGKLRLHNAAKIMGHKESAPIMQQILFLEKQGLLKKEGKGKKTVYVYTKEN